MPEGVEALITAEAIKNWASKNPNNKFFLKEIRDTANLYRSPIDFENFNTLYSKIDIENVRSFGKYIIIPSVNGMKLIVHLCMTGLFTNVESKHTRIVFSNGEENLYYNDVRKFGKLSLCSDYPYILRNLMDNSIEWREIDAAEQFAARMRKRKQHLKQNIKYILLRQLVICGIGNIYAAEGLFLSKIHPRTLVKDLSDNKLIEIVRNCQSVMKKSYYLGGMTISDFYCFGKKGNGKRLLNVYDREGLSCKECHCSVIQKFNISNRPTYFCPTCQKEEV